MLNHSCWEIQFKLDVEKIMVAEQDIYQRLLIRAAGKAQRKTDKKRHDCLFPGCNKTAISSHSQQRKGQLQAISHNGHVYAVEKNLYRNLKKNTKNDFSRFSLFPTSTATTFPGFCPAHDSNVFRPIEKNGLTIGDPEQSLLLFLRAHAFEHLQKKRVFIWQTHFLNDVGNFLNPEVFEMYRLRMIGIRQYLEMDSPYYFNILFNALKNKQFDVIQSTWVVIPKNIMISSSCCMSPLMTKHTEYMENNHEKIQPSVTFSVIPNSKMTHVVTSWLNEHDDISNWFKDAVTDSIELELLINQCAFGETEDTCISPVLWDSLSATDKEMVTRAVAFTRKLETPAPLPTIIKL